MSSLDKRSNDAEDKTEDKSKIISRNENENEENELNTMEAPEILVEGVHERESSSTSEDSDALFKDVSELGGQKDTVDITDESSSRVQQNRSRKYLSYALIGLFVAGLLFFIGFTLLHDSEASKAQAQHAVESLFFTQDQHYLKENITQNDIDEAKLVIGELNFFNRRTYEDEVVEVQRKYDLLLELNNVYQADTLLLNGNQQTAWETLVLQPDTSVETQEQYLASVEALEQDPMIEDIYKLHQYALTTLNQIEQAKKLVTDLPTGIATRGELPQAVDIIKQVESEIEGISQHPQMEQVNQQLLESANMVGQVFIAGADLGDYDPTLEEAFYDSIVLSKSLRGSSFDNSPLIALTFDDGPNEEYTTQLLDILAKHDVKATFFVMGAYVDEYPEVARRIVEEGHLIANHTYNHYDLSAISDEEVLIQFEWTQDSIEDATGVIPDTYRLPFGAGGKRVIDLVPHMTSILWNLDSMDWESHDVDVIYDTIMNHMQHHTLLLMHDTHQATPDTIDRLIPVLKERGYSFVMPEELDFDMRYFAE